MRHCRHLLQLALAVVVILSGTSALAAPSAAAADCSIRLPARLTVDGPWKRFPASLASNCDVNGWEYASWEIVHSYQGPEGIFIFDGNSTDDWGFYDWDYLGKYTIEPSSAWDWDYNDLSQNTLTVTVRLGSRLALSTSRSGQYVTLRGTARKYTPSASAFRPWRDRNVTFYKRTCKTCDWQRVGARKTNQTGVASMRVKSAKARDYRAVVASTGTTWGRTSAIHRR